MVYVTGGASHDLKLAVEETAIDSCAFLNAVVCCSAVEHPVAHQPQHCQVNIRHDCALVDCMLPL